MWDLNDIAPETVAQQAEREIVEDIVRAETAPHNGCDRCHTVRELYHDDETGLALCDDCLRVPVAAPAPIADVRFKRLRSGAWGLTGPAELLAPGAVVHVVKRDGSSTAVRVRTVLWSGDGKAITTIAR